MSEDMRPTEDELTDFIDRYKAFKASLSITEFAVTEKVKIPISVDRVKVKNELNAMKTEFLTLLDQLKIENNALVS